MGLIFRTMKPNIIHAYLIALNIVTFGIYGFDKHQAIKSQMRVPELILHLLALMGGSPAAAIAQIIFRHKTKKTSFRIIFFLIIGLQITAYFIAVYLAYKAA
jgi:uncharacterized membrane protein YsdA (DUF1294 family)